MDILSILSNIQFLWFLIGSLVTVTAFLILFFKKEKRLFKNLKRPVAIIASREDTMSQETELLQRVGFFDIHLLQDSQRGIDLVDNRYRMVILRYQKDSESFWKTFDSLTGKTIPVVVFAKPGEIDGPDIKRIQGYSLHTLCNTPLRLISDVFAVMSTYPEGQI